MLEDRDKEWKFNLELPDIESIFILTAVCILSGIFMAVSLVIAFTLSSSYFDGLSGLSFDSADAFLSTLGDTLLYIGGIIFAISSIFFFRALLGSLVALYSFTIRGESTAKIPATVKKLYVSVWVGGGAALLIFVGIIISQLYDLIADYLVVGGF